MKKSNKIVAVLLALVMIITAVPMMTVSADIGGTGDAKDEHKHVYVIQSETEGSCTETAKTTFKCSCGDVQVMTSGTPAHTPAVGGYKTKNDEVHTNYCTVCKEVFEEKHDYVIDPEESVASTCKAGGKEVYKCEVCKVKKVVALEPSVHTPADKIVSDANKHGFVCGACDKLIDEEHVWDEGTPDGRIKCGDSGKIIYTCLVDGCDGKKEVTVPSACVYPDKEAIEKGWAPKIQYKDADGVENYDEDGHTFECIYCGKDKPEAHEFVVEYKIVPVDSARTMSMRTADEETTTEPVSEESTESTTESEETTTEHVHEYNELVAYKPATCYDDGYKTNRCECGDDKTETISKTTVEHNYKWEYPVKPTMDENGHRVQVCTVCYAKGEKQDTRLNTPTCQTEGEIEVSCKYCEYSYTAKVDTIDHEIVEDAKYTKFSKDHHKTQCVYCGEVKMPHTWGEWKVETPATTEKEGKKVRVCADCGQEEVETISKLTGKLGDVNGDGQVTAVDARIILQVVAELRTLNAKEQEAADMNADGNVTAVDARMILQAVADGE